MPSIALVPEGDYDVEALTPLIRRVNNEEIEIFGRPCGGPVNGRYLKRLQEFKYRQIDRAVVVADAGQGDPETIRQKLEHGLRGTKLPFDVRFVVVVRELEALLLADPTAIEKVCAQRGAELHLHQLKTSPEQLQDPKAELRTILGRVKIGYTKVVAAEIASAADLDLLDYWCGSFRRLRYAVLLE